MKRIIWHARPAPLLRHEKHAWPLRRCAFLWYPLRHDLPCEKETRATMCPRDLQRLTSRRRGRVVEGGSLENCCAARYRGFESYFLRQVTPSPSDGAFFMPGRARTTGKEDSNREVMRRPGNPHCGHAKAPSSGAFASSSHYSTLTRVSAESVPRGHAFAARQPRRTRWALRPTRPRRAAFAADRA